MISVVMPAYNAARYVAAAIQSVLGQTHRDFELIVIDDGSTDDTLAIARWYESTDPRVRVITHANIGMGASLNDAIATARHEWIARIDADDLMMPERLESQLRFVAANPDIAVAGSWVQYIDRRGRVLGRKCHPLTRREQVQKTVRKDKLIPLTHPSVLMRRSAFLAVGGYRPEFWPSDDLDLWARCVDAGYGILVQPELLTRYRIHPDSICCAKARYTLRRVRWVRECMIRRRRGDPECSWEEFADAQRNLPLAKRIEAERKLAARTMLKVAGLAYAERHYHIALAGLVASTVLQPYALWLKPVWKRTRSLLRRRMPRFFVPETMKLPPPHMTGSAHDAMPDAR